LYFAANNGTQGHELWKLSVPKLGPGVETNQAAPGNALMPDGDRSASPESQPTLLILIFFFCRNHPFFRRIRTRPRQGRQRIFVLSGSNNNPLTHTTGHDDHTARMWPRNGSFSSMPSPARRALSTFNRPLST
jgi:hypothetical protein